MSLQTIDRYEIREVLGAGGFATVYLAHDPRLDALVAVKVLAENWTYDPEVRKRFRSEAVLLRRVQQDATVPGMVEVFDIGQSEDGRPFFVMSYADQGTLAERAAGKAWSPQQVRPVVEALAETTAALHAAGVVHRDLKPSNLMLRSDRSATAGRENGLIRTGERLVVGDLGLAKDLATNTSALSIAGGSGRYVAPEQLRFDGDVDGRADVHALSVLVAELVLGDDAMPRADHRLDPECPQGVSPRLWEALQRGMAAERDDRPATIAAWKSSILAAIDSAPPPPPRHAPPVAVAADTAAPPPPAERVATVPEVSAETIPDTEKRSRVPLLLTGAVVVAAAIVAIGLSLGGSGFEIRGPSEIEVGEEVTFDTNADDVSAVVWTDWADDEIAQPALSVTARLPGVLRFSATADGDGAEYRVEVVASPKGPTINGPTTLGIGEEGGYEAQLQATDRSHYWLAPGGERFDGGDLKVTPSTAGTLLVSLIAVGEDGVERGNRMVVQVE